jgi:hypothetical protein
MMKCPVCSKDKTLYEMRPLINVRELSVGNDLSEQKAEREVGGAKLQMVCRNCWQAILDSKEKSEVIEILETLAALLLEQDQRHREQAKKFELVETIEKARVSRATPFVAPSHPQYPNPFRDDEYRTPVYPPNGSPWGMPPTVGPSWVVGTGMQINWGSIRSLGDDFAQLTVSNTP